MDNSPPLQAASAKTKKNGNSGSYSFLISILPFRLILFAVFQLLVSGLLGLAAVQTPWQASSAWWLITAALTNIVTIFFLVRLFKREDLTYFQVFKFEKQFIKKDLLVLAGIFLISGPVAMLPSMLGASWIFGDSQTANKLLIQSLPLWAAWFGLIIFPITIAFAELPFYFGYLMPRLEMISGKKWLSILLPVLFLGAQHMTLPLIFNGRFMLWRLVAFLPFALLLGLVIHWRSRLLPYLMIVHGLMDMATAVMVLLVSMGKMVI
jgi:membrane protease YdiL (CAAX protease family)